jgi:DNA primase
MISKPDLATVLEHYGLRIVEKHGWMPCKCVVHEDSHASAAYNLDKQAYNCLVCNLLGDVYDLVAAKEGVDFKNAKRIAERIANGNSRQVRQVTHATGSVLPAGARNNRGSGGYLPSWKRRGA